MEKTESKTGGIAKFIEEAKHYRDNPTVLNKIIEAMSEKIDELQAKAAAYDRLMTGGRKTLKEWANFLGKCFAVDPDGFGYSFGSKPIIKDEHWWPDGDRIAYSAIRPDLIDFNGDWKDSLTLPDGWEEE